MACPAIPRNKTGITGVHPNDPALLTSSASADFTSKNLPRGSTAPSTCRRCYPWIIGPHRPSWEFGSQLDKHIQDHCQKSWPNFKHSASSKCDSGLKEVIMKPQSITTNSRFKILQHETRLSVRIPSITLPLDVHPLFAHLIPKLRAFRLACKPWWPQTKSGSCRYWKYLLKVKVCQSLGVQTFNHICLVAALRSLEFRRCFSLNKFFDS